MYLAATCLLVCDCLQSIDSSVWDCGGKGPRKSSGPPLPATNSPQGHPHSPPTATTGAFSIFIIFADLINGNLIFAFFKKRFYLFIFREKGREGEREGEKHQCVAASQSPAPGTWPATQACALTGN